MDTPKPQTRERESGYDLLRIWAMVAVVATHVLMIYRVAGARVSGVSVLDQLLHFAVPVFFFVSGALVWGGYRVFTREYYARFLRRRAASVAAPYLAWSAVYLTIAALRGNWVYWVSHSPLLVLTGRSWYHLYFVPVLLLFYLLTPLAARLIRRWPELSVIVAYVAGLLLLSPATAFASRVGGPMLVTFTAVAVTHAGHMTLGAWFTRRRVVVLPTLRKRWPVLVVAGSALLTGHAVGLPGVVEGGLLSGSVVRVGMALLVLGLAGLAFRVNLTEPASGRVQRVAVLTFGVYLVHPATLLAWRTGVTALGGSRLWESGWFAACSVLVVTAASLAIGFALSMRPSTAWLVGCTATTSGRRQLAGRSEPGVVAPEA